MITRLKLSDVQLKIMVYFEIVVVMVGLALFEKSLGRILICECGYVKFWHGQVMSSENSQHLFDWYTFSHIIHGFGFYYLALKVNRWSNWKVNWLLIVVVFESLWEGVENSSFIIERYREGTASLDYYGDSIVNSLSDVVAMIGGYLLANKVKLWWVIGLTVVMEVGTALIIRDNLTLNIIMLIYPIESIKLWQLGI